ncbi:prenyltransferase [bacterium]|nr:prenyltransferase [bacterium]
MHSFLEKFSLYFKVCRGYSIPISLMSCIVPFLYALIHKGNVLYGLIAIVGVVILHLATNLFDDIVDYSREKAEIDKGLKSDFNFQAQKCLYIREGIFSLKKAMILNLFLFSVSFLICIFFVHVVGFKLFYVVIPASIICILYPILGCLGLGEILVAIVFSPLIYSGIYLVMTGDFSTNIMIYSISTGLLAVAVLHNHMLLDYKFDKTNRKITLSRLCGNEYNALILLILIIIMAYINIIVWILLEKIGIIYILTFITLPIAIKLIKVMKKHIKSPEEQIEYSIFMGTKETINKFPPEQQNFMMKFFLAQNILYSFSLILCIAILIDKLVIK